jgi:trehalose 6-phosphate phosphatase
VARPQRPATLDEAIRRFAAFVDGRPGVLVEEKTFGVALHYRMNSAVEAAAKALAEDLARELGLVVQHGKSMVELRAAGSDKGSAVHRLMSRPPMRGTPPIFVGDDITDEAGFGAARQLGGHGILVGPSRATAAEFGLPCPADLRRWLAEAVG